jgi:DNA repair protein RecN (Recombination protein N)
MLNKLLINNFIIIEKVLIEFQKGFNIIIGETGAGKSIVIDAMMLLFGDKASIDLIRQGANKAIIEASFTFENEANILEILKDDQFDVETNEIIIRREIPLKGNSRCFINDTPVTLSTIKNYSKYFVDFYGQNSQHKLLEKENQLSFLDNFIENKSLIDNYNRIYSKLKQTIDEFNTLKLKKKSDMQQTALFEAQLNEINEVNPQLEEDINLENELKLLENAELLVSLSNNFSSCLNDNDNTTSAYTRLLDAKKYLTDLLNFDNKFETYLSEFESALIAIDETVKFVNNYADNIEFNPARIEEIRIRFSKIRKLQKKYGEISDIIQLKEELEQKLSLIENYDIILSDIQKDIDKQKLELADIALKLHNERYKYAKILEVKLVEKLQELAIKDAVFEIKFSTDEVTKEEFLNNEIISISYENKYIKANFSGIDNIEFYISTNKGEPTAPLVDTVSGGEFSRIMLALKSIIAGFDNIPILIFDEIDTGISGRIAQKVGLNMRELSKYHQIISVTHLPQIAALSDNCVVISKREENNRVTTSAKQLSYTDKVNEIAKMLSGENITEAARKSAEELIKI